MELDLELALFRNISEETDRRKSPMPAKSEPALALNLFSFVGQFFFHTRPTKYNANLENIFLPCDCV